MLKMRPTSILPRLPGRTLELNRRDTWRHKENYNISGGSVMDDELKTYLELMRSDIYIRMPDLHAGFSYVIVARNAPLEYLNSLSNENKLTACQ